MNKIPKAVIISDVHYSLTTLELADIAFRAAIDKAAELNIPLIDAGDITNDKAIIRGEVANRLIETLAYAQHKQVKVILLIGNHSLLNEKAPEHALNFLRPYAQIIDSPKQDLGMTFIPYQTNQDKLKDLLQELPKESILIMHQGFMGANMGDYIQDKTSIDPELLKDFTVISGHYHRHQTLGTVTYVGNPYTLTFGEANDGPKGYLILNEDGSFTREILNLRKHVILEIDTNTILSPIPEIQADDLLWVKVRGPRSELQNMNKERIGKVLVGHSNFKLELIPEKSEINVNQKIDHNMSDSDMLDKLIEETSETTEQKTFLKQLWRTLL